MKNLLLVVFTMTFLMSCKTTNLLMEPKSERNTDIAALNDAFLFNPDYQYHLRKNDKIAISVWGEDLLSVGSSYGIYNSNEVYGKWLMVDHNGFIEVPKLGSVHVLNKTIIELKAALKQRLLKWLINPIVDVKVLNREITVLGEVRNPQTLKIDKEHNTLLELIARCEGFEFYADIKYVKILRQEGENVRIATIDLSKSGNYLYKNIQLYSGDIVIVPSKKHKEFDKRVSVIIPFTTTITAAAILFGVLK